MYTRIFFLKKNRPTDLVSGIYVEIVFQGKQRVTEKQTTCKRRKQRGPYSVYTHTHTHTHTHTRVCV